MFWKSIWSVYRLLLTSPVARQPTAHCTQVTKLTHHKRSSWLVLLDIALMRPLKRAHQPRKTRHMHIYARVMTGSANGVAEATILTRLGGVLAFVGLDVLLTMSTRQSSLPQRRFSCHFCQIQRLWFVAGLSLITVNRRLKAMSTLQGVPRPVKIATPPTERSTLLAHAQSLETRAQSSFRPLSHFDGRT